MKNKRFVVRFAYIFITCLVASNGFIKAQEVLDILPKTSRSDLHHLFLISRADSLWNARRDAVEQSLVSETAFYARQKQLHNGYLELLGDFPEKSPLNAVVVDTINTGDVYRIERLHYQSLPNHHVTANFYIPDTGIAPFPSVIITCGHYPEAKTYTDYQDLAILFAKNGIAALIVDPIAQGERHQVVNDDGSVFFNKAEEIGTTEANILDVGSLLVGRSIVGYELWDNHRGVDYLYSRTDLVDTSKIGCTGHSGGGAQASFLLAYDKRLKVGAVANYLMTKERLYSSPVSYYGPQTGSQNLYYEGIYGFEHADYINLFAPKPFLIVASTGDMFPIEATHVTYNEVERIYDSLGVAENFDMFESPDNHPFSKIKREADVRWFMKWFYNNNDTVIEGAQTKLDDSELIVTEEGQVMYEFENELNIPQLNINMFDSLADDRAAFWSENTGDSCISKVKELIRIEEYEEVEIVDSGTIDRGNYTVKRFLIKSGDHVPIPALFFEKKDITGKLPTILYVDGNGKNTDAKAGGVIEQHFVDSGYNVLSIDVRGFGETHDGTNDPQEWNFEHRNGYVSLYIGKTLIGQRVEDICKALDVLSDNPNVDTSKIILAGVGFAGPAVIHAGVIDSRTDEIRLYNSMTSYDSILYTPSGRDFETQVVPGALKFYDLTDLIDAFSPKPFKYFAEPLFAELSIPETGKENYILHNYPNPFKTYTNIGYTLARSSHVSLQVCDQEGRLVELLVDEQQGQGSYNFRFGTPSLANGLYIYKLKIDGNYVETGKMIKLP